MGREIVTIHLGQAGVQLSHALWDLVCIEHGINSEGYQIDYIGNVLEGTGTEYVFREVSDQKFVPRALLVDLEPSVIDEIRTGAFRQLWSPQQLITGKEDAASNFARGYYSQTRFEMGDVINRIRIMVEQCENMTCFKLLYSANGGTGSGLTSALCERLSDEYGKKYKFATAVYPSPGYSELMVEPYNALLHSSTNLTFCDCVILTDNEALLNVMEDSLKSRSKGFTMINRVVANAVTTQFLSHRYNFIGQHHTNVNELLTNLIPYPRIHFPMMAFAPIFGPCEEMFEKSSASELLNEVFDDTNQLLSVTTAKRAYISCALLFRGNITPVDAIRGIASIKGSRLNRARFVDWCPTGFKLGINSSSPVQERDRTGLALRNSSLSMIAGNLAVRDVWTGISRRFDHLYRKRAYVHWYVAEGMEEGEFALAREVIQQLVDDYESIAKDAEAFGPDSSSNHVTTTSNNQFVYRDRMDKRLSPLSSRPGGVHRAPTLDDQNSLRTFDMNDENVPFHMNQHNISSLLMEQNYQTPMSYDEDDGRSINELVHDENLQKPVYQHSHGRILTGRRKNDYLPPVGRPYSRHPKFMKVDRDSGSSEFKSDLNMAMNYGTNCSAAMGQDMRDKLDQLKNLKNYEPLLRRRKEELKMHHHQQQYVGYNKNDIGHKILADPGEPQHYRSHHHCTSRNACKTGRNCEKCHHNIGPRIPGSHHRCGFKAETDGRNNGTHVQRVQINKPKPNGDGLGGYELDGPLTPGLVKTTESCSNEHPINTKNAIISDSPNENLNNYDYGAMKPYARIVGSAQYQLVPDSQAQLIGSDFCEYGSERMTPTTNHTNSSQASTNRSGSIQTCPDEFYYHSKKHHRIGTRHRVHHHHHHSKTSTSSTNHQQHHHGHRKCHHKNRIQLDTGRRSQTPPNSWTSSFQAESEPTLRIIHEESDTATDTEVVLATRRGNQAEPGTNTTATRTRVSSCMARDKPQALVLENSPESVLSDQLSNIHLVDIDSNENEPRKHGHNKPTAKAKPNPTLQTDQVEFEVKT